MSVVQPRVVADRYRLVEPLGQGGMGRVWKARDELLHRDVAIKELVPPPGLTPDELQEMRERTMREARAIARLNHPNVVRIFDILRTDGDPWIVMEYVASRSLHDVLAEDGPLPTRRVAEIGLGMLAALRAAHRSGVVHRDVKPGNVLLGDDGRVVLTDFGLATVPGDPVVTRTGLVLGSPAYISPERAHDGTAEPASDMWSLGATLYAAAEGQSPFARPSAIATLAALATEPPAPTRRAGSALRPVFNGLLRKDPAERMSADEVEIRLLRASGRRQRPSFARVPRVRKPPAEEHRPAPVVAASGGPLAVTKVESAAPARAAVPVKPPEPAEPEPAPDTADAPSVPASTKDRLRTALPWLAAAAALLVAVTVLIVVITLADDDSNPSGARPAPTSPAAAPPQQPPAPATPAPTTPAATASQSTPGDGAVVLPAGWHIYRDRTGFSVAVPADWRVSRDGTLVYFREQRGQRRVLGIDQSGQPKDDPVADWTQLEARRRANGDWADYHRIRIEPVQYFVKAADWEYTYTGSGGVRLHVINRGFVASPDQAHAIFWLTPDETWADNLDEFDLITRSFKPIP